MDILEVKEAARKGHCFIAFDSQGKQIKDSVDHYYEYEKSTAEKVICKKGKNVCINGISVILKEKVEEIWFYIPVDMLIEKENLQVIKGKRIPEQVPEIDLSKYGFDVKEVDNFSRRYIG